MDCLRVALPAASCPAGSAISSASCKRAARATLPIHGSARGQNKPIAPGDLANALGADQINAIASQSGLSPDDLLKGLSQYLPDVIDHLTPDGRLPNANEITGRI